MITYRGYEVEYDAYPMIRKQFKWSFVHEDYDGAGPDYRDPRAGFGKSFNDCCTQIDDIEDDRRAQEEKLSLGDSADPGIPQPGT